MKKALNFVVSTIVSIMLVVPAGFGFAQTSDLGAESTGLLPSNPFYFLKEWGRGVRKFMTFNPLRKLELELNIVSEKAAEFKKLEEITPENAVALSKAADNYENAIEQFKLRLDLLSETSNNPNVDRFLTQLLERSLRHNELLNDLQEKFSTEEDLRENIEETKDKLAETIATALEKDTPERLKARFAGILSGSGFNELRVAEFVDRLEARSSGLNKDALRSIKGDLLIKLSGKLQGLNLVPGGDVSLSDVLQSSADHLLRVRLLDEVRENVLSSELKSELNIIRQDILEHAQEASGISESEAGASIKNAEQDVKELEEKISQMSSVRAAIKELLSRAKFNLEQAKELFEEKNYSGTLGQATASSAAAKNALLQLSPSESDNKQVLESLKSQYDVLASRVKGGDFNTASPKLFDLLGEAEKKLIELEKLIAINAVTEVVSLSIRNVKLILATIEQLISQ